MFISGFLPVSQVVWCPKTVTQIKQLNMHKDALKSCESSIEKTNR